MRLYFIHIFAFLAVWFSTYYPGIDILISISYLIVIALEARLIKHLEKWEKVFIFILWQITGIFFSLAKLIEINVHYLNDYAIFILQLWYTPVIPLVSIIPEPYNFDKPFYYYLLIGMPIIMAVYFYFFSWNPGEYIKNKHEYLDNQN